MKEQIPEEVKGKRSNVLLELNEKNKQAYETELLGRRAEVLLEERIQKEGREFYSGYTKEYVKVLVPADGREENQILEGILERCGDGGLTIR